MRADLVVRGGLVVDGSGGTPYEADVAVAGERIVGVGRWSGGADEEIDARGKIVTPGFVDIHTHLDAQLAWDPLGAPSPHHGVTSAIVGNCGVGFSPCRPADRDYLMFLMEGVEDIPREAMRRGIDWQWESFPDYLGFLSRRKLAMNVGAHLSHAPLRVFAMGERGSTDAEPTDDELALMHRCVGEAMAAGALGFSTGRTTMHRTPNWDPVPGTFAARRELDALTDALAASGVGVLQTIPYGGAGEDAAGYERELEWMEPVSRQLGRPISFGLIQNVGYPDGWRDVLVRSSEAARRGARLLPQIAVRSVGLLLGAGTSINPLTMFPAAGDLLGRPWDEVRSALRDPALRAQLVESTRDSTGEIFGGMGTVDLVFPLDFATASRNVLAYDTAPERSVVARGRASGRSPFAVMLDHLVATDWNGFLLVALFNFDMQAAAEMLTHPLTMIGLGDSGAHTSQTSDAGFPTFTLGYWVREKKLLTLEAAVRKLSFDPAHVWGLRDRGLLRRGAFADLNVIDLDHLDLAPPSLRHDFPGGAAHFHQGAVGYDATIVNGQIVMRDGAHVGALPGHPLRNELHD